MRPALRRACFCLALLAAAGAGLPATEPELAVVVHPDNSLRTITRSELSKIFLKRLRTWEDGTEAKPVDQAPDSRAREQFTRVVHGRSLVTVEIYWKRMIFSGRAVPPVEMESEKQVLEYVRSTPGAVGYVTKPGSEPLEGVRELIVK